MSSSDPGVMMEVLSVGEDVGFEGEIGQALNINESASKGWDFPFDVKGLKINCNLTLNFDFSANIYAKWDWPPVGAELNRCDLISTLTTTVTGKYSTSFTWDKKLADVRVYKKAMFEVYFQFYLHVNVDGSIEVNIKKVDKYGVRWNASRKAFDRVDAHYTPRNQIVIDADAYLSIEPAMLLHVVFFGDVAKLSVEVGVRMHATAVIRNITNALHGQKVPTCIDITAWLEGKVNIKVGKWDDDEVKPKGILWDKNFPFKSGYFIDVHLEDGKTVGKHGECNRHDVTVKFNTHGGSKINDLTIEWGSCIRVGNPSRKGYFFTGWFYDSSLKNKVDFKTPITESMTIHAGWAKKTMTIDNPPDPTEEEYDDTDPSTEMVVSPPPSTVFQPIPVTSVQLSTNKATVFTEGEHHTAQLDATLLPLNAENRDLIWTSSDTSVATVDSNGLVVGLKAGQAVITATSASNENAKDTCVVSVIQRVTSITLNKTTASVYTSDSGKTVQLTATALPQDADIRTITWKSSNPEIASVDSTGKVYGVSAGNAVITAISNMVPDVTATCNITVLQRARQVYLDNYNISLLRGESTQLNATVWPEDTSDKTVTWSSSDPAIATVDQNGLVTTTQAGIVTITATCADGSGQSTSVDITVEKELEIQGQIDDQVYYTGDATKAVIGSLIVSPASVMRIASNGYNLVWSISHQGKNATEVLLKPIDYTFTASNNTQYTAKAAQIELADILCEGSDTITITATAGPWSDSYSFHTNVITLNSLAEAVTLNRTTFRIQEGESITIPNTPIAVDSNQVVPAGTIVSLSGSDLYRDGVHFAKSSDGQTISFAQSGLYQFTAVYTVGNLKWYVDLTVYVEDSEGIVHLPVSNIVLSEKNVMLVVGDELTLSANVTPDDAYNKSITWETGDDSIVQVQNGKLTALSAGHTYVTATASDGSGVQDICYVQVEDFMHLSSDSIDIELYTGGQTDRLIGGVELTYESAVRLLSRGYIPVWTLEHRSGPNAADIALVETEFTAPDGLVVSGNGIRLLRINSTGKDVYTLKCSAGPYNASIPVTITVLQGDMLPTSIDLSTKTYTGTINERIELTIQPILIPSTSSLPESTEVSIVAPSNFWKSAESRGSTEADYCFVFTKSGTFNATVAFEGSNYYYEVPIVFEIADESGQIAVMAEEVTVTPYHVELLLGGSENLTASFTPNNAADKTIEWTSSDETVATVSTSGVVTAVGIGRAIIRANNEVSGAFGYSTINVEDGLTIEGGNQEFTVYLDGSTRKTVKTIYLSDASSARINQEPTWMLSRRTGTNLTLKAYPTQAIHNGNEVYGVDIDLYSVSRVGDTVYDLICISNDGEQASVTLTVHAVSRSDALPMTVELANDTFTGNVNQIISVDPVVICWPNGSSLPNDVRVSFAFDDATSSILNPNDYYVSRSHSTFSFTEAGTYYGILQYSHTNVSFNIPITFKVADESGNVPLFVTSAKITPSTLSLEPGNSAQLSVTCLPIDATTKTGTWSSSNTRIATVTQEGLVTAVAKGTSQIVWTPDDNHAEQAICGITVEDAFTVISETSNATLYLQGNPNWRIAGWHLSPGTASRLKAQGSVPEWTITKKSGNASQVRLVPSQDGMSVDLRSESLISGGQDVYTVAVQAGSESWSSTFTFRVVDLGINAPESITLATPMVNGTVGQTLNISFAPVTVPASAEIPEDLLTYSSIYGLGQFYDHLISMDDDGELLTVAFKDPGTYLAVRSYNDRNLQFNALCTITITGDGQEYAHSALDISDPDATVYVGGKSAVVSRVSFNDGGIPQTFRNAVSWSVERISGQSTSVGLLEDSTGVDVLIASVEQAGTDVWRITCSFGGYEENTDITIHAVEPYAILPQSASLRNSTFEGTQGNWINIPLTVECSPAGARLPDIGADYWSLTMDDGQGKEMMDFSVAGGVLRARFAESGYYTGVLKYSGGNVTFEFPVYFSVKDEEGIVQLPTGLGVFFPNASATLYSDGNVNTTIGTAVLSDRLDGYTASAGYAYANKYGDDWSIRITNGNACTLNIQKTSPGAANIVLTSITGTGEVTYSVTCSVNGMSYTASDTVHVVTAGEEKPELQLEKSNYTLHVGETISISSKIIDQRTHSALLSAEPEDWMNSAVLAAIGYDFDVVGDSWIATFYKAGTFQTTISVTYGNLTWNLPLVFKVLPAGEEVNLTMFKLPSALQEIEDEAFLGASIEALDLRGTNVQVIGNAAFKNCRTLQVVYWNGSIRSIAADAFSGCTDVIFYASQNATVVIQFAHDHNIELIITD